MVVGAGALGAPGRHWHVRVNGTVSDTVCCSDLISTPIALDSVPARAYDVTLIDSWWVRGPPAAKDSLRQARSTTVPPEETQR